MITFRDLAAFAATLLVITSIAVWTPSPAPGASELVGAYSEAGR